MQFNEKLKKLRLEKQMTQEELAKQIFVSRSAVAKWENGLGLPSEQSLELLARCFGVKVSELLADPQTEAIIVNKNNTLSRQKIAIVGLIAFLGIIIVIISILLPHATKNPSPIPEQPRITRELIFETEKDLQTGNLPIYSDDEVNDSNLEFAPSRTFAAYSDYKVDIPALTLKITTDGVVNFEQIDINNIYSSGFTWISCDESDQLSLYFHDAFDIPFAEVGINLKYLDLFVSVKIIRHPAVPVEAISINMENGKETIELGEKRKPLYANASPANASYTDVEFSIEKILTPHGFEYTGDLSQYAFIDRAYLSTTKYIELGAAIHIVATTRAEGIRSNTLIIYVTRTPIKNITFDTQYPSESDILLGKSLTITNFYVHPDNASFNLLNEWLTVDILTPHLVTLYKTDNGWRITATDDAKAVGSTIRLAVSTPEGYRHIFWWKIAPIPIESITLVNADTGKELEDITYLARGSTLRLKAVVMPKNATYNRIGYFSSISNIQLSDDNTLTITMSEDADIDTLAFIQVNAELCYSKNYTIAVQKIPVESVTLSIETNIIQKDIAYPLSYEVYPANADIDSIKFYLLEDIYGIVISGNMLYVTTAPGGTVFHVLLQCDGVISNVLELTVQPAPLRELQIGFDTFKPIKGQLNQIDVYYYPLYADFEITFKILDDVAGIYIIGDQIFIAPEVKTGTVFRIQAFADGIESNILTLTVSDAKIT